MSRFLVIRLRQRIEFVCRCGKCLVFQCLSTLSRTELCLRLMARHGAIPSASFCHLSTREPQNLFTWGLLSDFWQCAREREGAVGCFCPTLQEPGRTIGFDTVLTGHSTMVHFIFLRQKTWEGNYVVRQRRQIPHPQGDPDTVLTVSVSEFPGLLVKFILTLLAFSSLSFLMQTLLPSILSLCISAVQGRGFLMPSPYKSRRDLAYIDLSGYPRSSLSVFLFAFLSVQVILNLRPF